MTRVAKLLLVVSGTMQAAIFVTVAFRRIIDADEGIYLLASRLVFEHKLPYRDFLYLQTPLLPYVYGLWMKFVGASWISGRILSVVIATALGTMLQFHVYSQTKKWLAGLFAFAIYLSSPDILGWSTTVKTYPLSGLLLFGAYASLFESSSIGAAASGLLFGLAVDTRLYVAGALPIFLVWVHSNRKSFLHFLAAFAVAIAPNLCFLLASPAAYVFGNLGLHAIRSNRGLIGDFVQKGHILGELAGDVQFCWLLIIASVFVLIFGTQSVAAKRSLALGLSLALISLLPTPTYLQYFCLAVPFLVTATVCAVSGAVDQAQSNWGKSLVVVASAGLVLTCIGLSLAKGQYQQYTNGIPGMRLISWKWETASRVSGAIDEMTRPGEAVLSSWPGYIFDSKASAFPGTENQSGLAVSAALSRAQLDRYRIISNEQINRIILGHLVRVAAVGNSNSPPGMQPAPEYQSLLRQAGYRRIYAIGDTSVWVW